MVNSFFYKKKVFLTGHTGFKGSWMLAWLHSIGAEVKGYALEPDKNVNTLYRVIEGDTICESILADIRDKDRVYHEIKVFQPDVVFHLAAQPLVRYSYQNPIETFEVNALGTANVLEAVRGLDKKCAVLIITTDKVYQNNEWYYPYRETDRLGGYDPYSASKAAAEIITDSFRNSFFNVTEYHIHQKSIATARAGNVIGGGDWSKDRILPDVIRSLMNNETISIRNPDAVRPWQHVLEAVYGYLLLAAELSSNPEKFCEAWNFGPYPQDTFTVKQLVEMAIKIWGTGNFTVDASSAQPHEAGLLKLDINKSINKLGWAPKFNADRSIENTIDWYRAENKKECTYAQIEKYINFNEGTD